MIWKIKAFGKCNLFLNIFKKKDVVSKKHFLQGLFFLDYSHFDEIIITEGTLKITYFSNQKEFSIPDDVCSKVIAWFKKRFQIKTISYHFFIYKNIPFGAGLGGSSTDGAVVLTFLLKMYNLKLTLLDKLDLARNISSDLCFFLQNASFAYVSGIGERVLPLPIKINAHYVVLNSYFCSTKEIFASFDQCNTWSFHFSLRLLIFWLHKKKYACFFNNLQPVVFKNINGLQTEFLKLKKQNKHVFVQLNGSGSSFLVVKQ